MSNRMKLMSAAGLAAALSAATYAAAQQAVEPATPVTADFSQAAVAEVRDAQGQALLRGQFVLQQEDDDDVERKAKLEPTGIDADATGEAEVEHDRENATTQEVEFAVANLEAGAAVTFVIDGTAIGTRTVDSRGRAELEVDVRVPSSGR